MPPGLISCLQDIIAKDPAPGRWILIGSQSPPPAGTGGPVIGRAVRGVSAVAVDLGRDQTLCQTSREP